MQQEDWYVVASSLLLLYCGSIYSSCGAWCAGSPSSPPSLAFLFKNTTSSMDCHRTLVTWLTLRSEIKQIKLWCDWMWTYEFLVAVGLFTCVVVICFMNASCKYPQTDPSHPSSSPPSNTFDQLLTSNTSPRCYHNGTLSFPCNICYPLHSLLRLVLECTQSIF